MAPATNSPYLKKEKKNLDQIDLLGEEAKNELPEFYKGGKLNNDPEDGSDKSTFNPENLGKFDPSYKGKDLLDFNKKNIDDLYYKKRFLSEEPEINPNSLKQKFKKEKGNLKEEIKGNYDSLKEAPEKKADRFLSIRDRLNRINKWDSRDISDAYLFETGQLEGEGIHELVEKRHGIDTEEYVKEKEKKEYLDYLNSPEYREVAKEMWGNKYKKFIKDQKNDVKDVPVKFYQEMSPNSKEVFRRRRNTKAGFFAPFNEIWHRQPTGEAIQHELSHSTDNPTKPFPDDYFIPASTGYKVNPKYSDKRKNEIREKSEGMKSEYSKWERRFSTDGYTGEEAYVREPTEVRARINNIRSRMEEDGFDWNKASQEEIMNYLEKSDHPETIKQSIKDLDYLNPSDWNELMKKYASIDGAELDSIAEEVKQEIV